MTVTLELLPETERRVVALAAARGISLEAYLAALIEGGAPPARSELGGSEQFEADMDLLAEGCERLPVLPPARLHS